MVFPPQVVGPICTEVHREPIMRGDGMTTNRFATTCAICGGALAAGEGDVVINDGGSRRVVHPWCQPALAGGDARVEPVIVHRVLDAQLGTKWRDRFASFDDSPVAAASIGQVHRGIWRDGRVVAQSQGDIIETLFVHDLSVVTSGDYQRYVEIDGVRYHHIISPETLMPTHYMRSVSILTEHSGYADLLSTAVFLMPFDEGLAFVESLPGVEAVWVLNDCSVRMTKGAEAVARSFGASNHNP